MKKTWSMPAFGLVAAICITPLLAQDVPARGGRGGPAQTWWVNKTAGGVYKPPMRPLWKLSDLKQMHAGQNNWQEQIILDPEQDATYNSAAPGTKFPPRMHPDTPTVFVVVSGQVNFSFGHTPGAYTGDNKLMFNTFDDAIAGCKPGVAVLDDHIFASPLLGYVNAADNKCGTGNGNIGAGPAKAGDPPFDSHTIFGHIHAGPAEWLIVQVGQISGKFENTGEFHAVEGDVLYAAPMTWHQMAAEAPSGPNVRLAMGGYQLINMNNTATPAAGRGPR